MLVSSILKAKGSDIATIAPDATVEHAIAELKRIGVGALVASADGRSIAGIISERDIVRRIADHGADALTMTVSDLMTSEVHTCTLEDHVDGLMAMMTERRIRHVPVVQGDEMIGIVSIGDVVKSRVEELETERAQLEEYISGTR